MRRLPAAHRIADDAVLGDITRHRQGQDGGSQRTEQRHDPAQPALGQDGGDGRECQRNRHGEHDGMVRQKRRKE